MPTDLYDVLGVPADASPEELKRAYRSRVREYHPDVNDHPDGDAQFKLIRKANDVLTDPAERKDYDRMGHREYAEKRLDELPPFSVFPEFDEEEINRSDDGETERTSTTSSSTTETASSTTGSTATQSTTSTGSNQNRQTNRTRQSSSTARTSGASEATGTATDRGASGTATERGTRGQRTATGETATAGAETTDSSQWADLSGEAARQTVQESSTSAGVRRRRGLRRWYGVAVVALLTYVGGLAAYLLAQRGSVLALVADLQAAPISTLASSYPLQSPTAYVLAAVDAAVAGTPGASLLLLVGTVLLPLVVLTAVAQYGHGSAWAYALASLGPVATLVGFQVVGLPVAVVLVGLVVLPLVSGLGFLVDVGRYLLATR